MADHRTIADHTRAMVAYLRDGLERMPHALREELESRHEERASELRSMGTQTGADGGYLMPETWTGEVRIQLQDSWLYREATVVESAEKYHGVSMTTLPTVAGVAQSGDGSVTATESTPKVHPFWLGLVDSTPVYGPLELRHVPAFVRVSRRLFEDALTVESLDRVLARAFAHAISGWLHGQLIDGTHSSTTVMGLKGSAANDPTRVIAATSATQVRWPDLGKVIEALGDGHFDFAHWLFHPRAYADFIASSGGAGGGATIAGRPFHFTQSLEAPASGGKTTVALFDPRHYVIAHNLGGLTVQRLDERFAPDGQLAFLINYRVDACIDTHRAFALLRST